MEHARRAGRLIAWVAVDETIAEAAGALGRQHLRPHPGIDAVDLIVVAVTQHLDAELTGPGEPGGVQWDVQARTSRGAR